MLGSSRTSVAALAVIVVALAVPATSHAQFGRLKKKVQDKITGDTAANGASTESSSSSTGDPNAKARQDAWQHPVAISSSALDGFLKGLKAENAERAKYVASAPPTSAMGRWNAYQSEKAKCEAGRAKADTAQMAIQKQMMAEATAGKSENIQKYTDSMTALGKAEQAREQRCNSLARPQFTEDDYKAVHAEEDREEAAGAAASGVSPFVYARLKERVIAYALMPSGWAASGYSPDELHAIDARKAEIKPLLGKDFNSSGQRNPVGG
ncbi:MAG TPA: hypothetical protein VGJ12_04180 [Gemmatimonadaceae bacterium]